MSEQCTNNIAANALILTYHRQMDLQFSPCHLQIHGRKHAVRASGLSTEVEDSDIIICIFHLLCVHKGTGCLLSFFPSIHTSHLSSMDLTLHEIAF